MSLPQKFLGLPNFELAYNRVVRGANKEYKQLYSHLLPSYALALQENLKDLIDDIRKRTYEPSTAIVIYQPKQSGVLRPLGLLSLRDLIVYQALANRIADALEQTQARYALKRTVGGIYGGRGSQFVFKSWKVCWKQYIAGIVKAHKSGAHWISDFDLVSFYELIDHNLLRECLKKKIKNGEFLELLGDCLGAWTTDTLSGRVRHGIPQGPEASTFLAECVLFNLDMLRLNKVKYFRYIDDIRIIGREESDVRRALLRLDLESKRLGLVPQAQKIETKRIPRLKDVIKTVPSGAVAGIQSTAASKASQSRLASMLKRSIIRSGNRIVVEDATQFKFALNRLEPRSDTLRKIRSVFLRRPDLSWTLGAYAARFGNSKTATRILLEVLSQNPVFDSVASSYIDALARCGAVAYEVESRKILKGIRARSEEKTILLVRSYKEFMASRMTPRRAAAYVRQEPSHGLRAILIHRLFSDQPKARFHTRDCLQLLEELVSSEDEDVARFAFTLLLGEWPWSSTVKWKPPMTVNRSVKLVMKGLGLRARAPAKEGVLPIFFKQKMGIGIDIPWRRALGKDLRDAERRCIRLQRLAVGDPSARVLILDTLNEILLQNFSKRHPTLTQPYKKAAGNNLHPIWVPGFGNPFLPQLYQRGSRG